MRTQPRIPPNAALVAVAVLLGSLSGCQSAIRVVDETTGRPVSGAKVEHGYIKDPNLVAILMTAATRKYIAIVTLTADDDGRVVARDVRMGHYLSVKAPGYLPTDASFQIEGWRIDDVLPLELRDGILILPLAPAARPGGAEG